MLVFPPDHLVNYSYITLNDLDNLVANLILIARYRDAVVAIGGHGYGKVNGLKEPFGVDTGENEASFIECLRTLRRCTDANGGNRFANTGIET